MTKAKVIRLCFLAIWPCIILPSASFCQSDSQSIPSSEMPEEFTSALKDATPQDISKIREKAEQGDAKAQWVLGWIYYTGMLVERDYTKGLEWMAKAGNQDLVFAQSQLG